MVQELFKIVEERAAFMAIEVTVNLLEIYNEDIRDLLIPKAKNGASQGLEIRRGPQGIFVPGLTSVPVSGAAEVMEVLSKGNLNRSVTATAMNAESSRSHSLLIVTVTTTNKTTGRALSASLTLVDLAGSERLSKSEVTGQARKVRRAALVVLRVAGRPLHSETTQKSASCPASAQRNGCPDLQEAQHINMSLSALADVVAARAQKQAHVPYRNSKLTALLQESLGGDSKTLMLVRPMSSLLRNLQ